MSPTELTKLQRFSTPQQVMWGGVVMAKVHADMTIDPDILDEAKRLNLNISGECNSFLKNLITIKKGDINTQNINLKLQERELRQKELSKVYAELKILNEEIQAFEKQQSQKELERIQQEKEQLKKSHTCSFCNEVRIPKYIRAMNKHGVVCDECYNISENYKNPLFSKIINGSKAE
jgi:hypothetical protein